jgi:hypothetical protein
MMFKMPASFSMKETSSQRREQDCQNQNLLKHRGLLLACERDMRFFRTRLRCYLRHLPRKETIGTVRPASSRISGQPAAKPDKAAGVGGYESKSRKVQSTRKRSTDPIVRGWKDCQSSRPWVGDEIPQDPTTRVKDLQVQQIPSFPSPARGRSCWSPKRRKSLLSIAEVI